MTLGIGFRIARRAYVRYQAVVLMCSLGLSLSAAADPVTLQREDFFTSKMIPKVGIGLLHCNVGSDTGHEEYALCTLEDLSRVGMDYWALGHAHRPQLLRDADPVICYAGATQGRGPVEVGEHGCWVIDVGEAGQVAARFHPTDGVRWANEVVELPEEATLDTGRTKVSVDLHREAIGVELLEDLRDSLLDRDPFVWVDRLTVWTRGLLDREARRDAPDFVGELIRQSEGLLADENALAQLRELLHPVFDHSRSTCSPT